MPLFIFMLTRHDVTIPDARQVLVEAVESGVSHIGCKDVGLPASELALLIEEMKSAGCTTYLEMVSDTPETMLNSASLASDLETDFLIGGTLVEPVMEIIEGTGIRFFPYVGQIVGHPCLLRGELEEIVADAVRADRLGVDGLNVLAYRYDGNVRKLVGAISTATKLPLVCAGSVDSLARVRELTALRVWGFTVGTAALEGRFVSRGSLTDQLRAILKASSTIQAPPDPK